MGNKHLKTYLSEVIQRSSSIPVSMGRYPSGLTKAPSPSDVHCVHGHCQLFIATCLCFGLDVQVGVSSLFSRLCLLGSIVIYAVNIYTTFLLWADTFSKPASCARVACLGDDLIYIILIVLILRMIILKRDALLELLEGSNEKWSKHLILLLLTTPFAAFHIYQATVDLGDNEPHFAIMNISNIYLRYMRKCLLMIYFEIISSLAHRSRRLLVALSTPYVKVTVLLREKWLIRDTISKLNRLFAMPLCLIYMQIFMGMIVSLSHSITGVDMLDSIMYPAGHGFFVIELYLLARRCSELEDLIVDIERATLQRHGKPLADTLSFSAGPSNISGSGQWQILRYDPKWDALRVAYFEHDTATFISFLSTSITCVAVVLQFDFKVMRVINDLADEYGKTLKVG